MPIRDAVAFVSIAMGHGNAYWDGVFALADRVDRAAPARANLAPLRTRLNLLATAAGTRLELDLWPHLRGITFCVLANAKEPARLRRVLVALHADDEAAARSIANEMIPRLVRLQAGSKPAKPAAAGPPVPAEPLRTLKLGRVSGEPLEVTSRGRTVLIGWGVGTLETAIESHDHLEDPSAVLLTADWKRMKQKAPDRAGGVLARAHARGGQGAGWAHTPGSMPCRRASGRLDGLDRPRPGETGLAGTDFTPWCSAFSKPFLSTRRDCHEPRPEQRQSPCT